MTTVKTQQNKAVREALSMEQMKEIALTYGRTKSIVMLAEEFGVSRQRVYQIAQNLRRHGVNIPRHTHYGKFKMISDEIIKKYPEMDARKNVEIEPII